MRMRNHGLCGDTRTGASTVVLALGMAGFVVASAKADDSVSSSPPDTMRNSRWSRRLIITIAAGIFLTGPMVAHAQRPNDPVGQIEFANPEMQGDGTLSQAAAAAMASGALRLDSDNELKAII